MNLSVRIENVQHLKSMEFNTAILPGKLLCIVGKNGVGKTTLIKSLANILRADTFKVTSTDSIFDASSSIIYSIDNTTHKYTYDSAIKSLNCKSVIPKDVLDNLDVELPIPHGHRFNFFQSISKVDGEIRNSIISGKYSDPIELIEFLNEVYSPDKKFSTLKQIVVKGTPYYFMLDKNNKYVREDYFSSGEYFLVSLYRKLYTKKKIIIVDEIDISLDAAAQVKLVDWLRKYSNLSSSSVIFTTHSLALMRKLEDNELFYMDNKNGNVSIIPASYGYVRSILFGFSGYDKYILTEDKMLHDFIKFIITHFDINPFFSYIVIYVGGADQVDDLARRNKSQKFFDASEVISIYDGDQSQNKFAQKQDSFCIPFESIEKKIYEDYFVHNKLEYFEMAESLRKGKKKYFYEKYKGAFDFSDHDIFAYLCKEYESDLNPLIAKLKSFLERKIT